MAGTITAGTLSDGTNSTSTTNCIQGSAKAWVNFNGTTGPGTIRAQYNVSSVTRNATGDYTVNFTTALADANYAGLVTSGVNGVNWGLAQLGATYTASQFQFKLFDPSGISQNCSIVNVAVFR